MTTITSPQNVQIKAARQLVQRRHRHAQGRLLVEGLRLIKDAWRSGVAPHQVFYNLDVRPVSHEVDDLLCQMEQRGIPAFACSAAAFEALCETQTPQGIAAIVPLPQLALPDDASLILLLDAVRDPGNAGTLLRSAEAAGVDFVVFAPGSVDAFNDKVMRAGMGVHFRLPLRICDSWTEVQKVLPPRLILYVAEANASLSYDQIDWCEACGLIVGNEANGPGEEASQLAQPIRIPMAGATESLNAAMAGTIILFEAARQRRAK